MDDQGQVVDVDAIDRAMRAWPGLAVDRQQFVTYLDGRGSDIGDEGLAELLLACGCRHGDARALEAFDAHYLDSVAPALAHMRLSPEVIDEVKQLVRHKLLLAGDSGASKVDGYAGKGRLRGLVQVVAVRLAISHLRKTKREIGELPELPSPDHDPELRFMKEKYRAIFSKAFEKAVRSLSSRERNFLRLQVHAGLTVDQIGGMYGVHRATATRWLTKIRSQLLRDTRQWMGKQLSATPEELDSVMNLIQSRLDVSVHRMLETVSEGAIPDERGSATDGA